MTAHSGYWGGSSVLGGRVRKLNADSFEQVVARYINIPVQHSMTRQEFFALPVKEQDKAKDGPYLTACTFVHDSEGHRSDENAASIHALFMDLDEGDFVKEIDEAPEALASQLYPFSFAAWRTAKSTPGKPRLKIMVDVAPCHPSELKRILKFIAARLGLPSNFKGVIESGVVSQPQYRPVQWRGSEFTAVIASNVSGVPVHISDLPEIEPDDEELISGRKYACDPNEGGDEFYGLAYLPVQGITVDDIVEPMKAIDPDCNRPMWLQVAAALRHQYTDESEAQQAFEAFTDWSSEGKKYEGRKDVWNLWRSLRPYAKGRAPVTLRTIFKYAMDAGWSNTAVATKLSQSIEEWFAECENKDELLLEGGKRIASLPFKNAVVEESLINSWRKRLIALGETIDKTTLRKEVVKVRRDDKKAKFEASEGNNMPGWLRPIVYVATSDSFLNLGSGVDLKPSAFDRFFAHEMMPKDGDTPANGVPTMQPGPYALNILKILRVEETMYDPTRTEDEKIYSCPDTGKIIMNTYNHNALPVPDPEHKDRAEKLIRQTIDPLIAEPEFREMLLSYLALQVKSPGIKIPWSFLIQSAPGAGKGTLGQIMEAVLAPNNVKIITSDMMKAGFNEWARNCVLGIFNEVHIPGDRRDQIMNGIKPLISDDTIGVTVKHGDAECRVPNFVNYIAFSNYRDAAHLAANDRRWSIIFSPYQTEAQVLALQASGHFEQIRWLITPEGASALRYYLMNHVISEDFPLKGHAPKTKYRQEVIEQSKNTLQISIEDAVEDAIDPLITAEAIHDGRLKEKLCLGSREASLMTRYLSLIGYERHGSKRVQLDGSRGHVWVHTERWQGGDPVEFLKKRLRDIPELEDFDFS